MKRFIKRSFDELPKALKSHNVHIVIGNEAADADSIVSTLSYAYLLNEKKTFKTDNSDFSFHAPKDAHVLTLLSIAKIGRASCRERV